MESHRKEHKHAIQALAYEGYTVREIRDKLGIADSRVRYIAKVEGIKIQKYGEKIRNRSSSVDPDLFSETVNTEEWHYLLGYLYLRGKLVEETSEISMRFTDMEELERIQQLLNGTHLPVYTKEYKGTPYYILKWYSLEQVEDLINIGLLSDKENRWYPTCLSKEMTSHFVRGYFDGAGRIYQYERKTKKGAATFATSIQISGSVDLLMKISDAAGLGHIITTDKGFTRLHYCSKKDLWTFFEYLYQNCTICNSVRYSKYIEILKKKLRVEQEEAPLVQSNLQDYK